MKTHLVAAVAALALASPAIAKPKRAIVAEAPAVNADGYRLASPFEKVKAQCELVANGLQPSPGFAMGSPEFVAGHAIGSAIGGMIAHAQNYEHCMTLNGFAKAQ